jgi:hypothetical protein
MGSLYKNSLTHGTVLNVFDNTVNVRTVEDDLFILSLGKITSPITSNIRRAHSERNEALSALVSKGDRVQFTAASNGARINLGNIAVFLNRPNYFDNRIENFNNTILVEFLPHFDFLLGILSEYANSRQGCLLNPDMTTKDLLPEFLKTIHSPAIFDITSEESTERMYDALLRLCGRGPGFTPAGDDFISGFLTMLNCIRRSLNLGHTIIPRDAFARLTTWTSFKLMEYNSKGLVDMEIEKLINSAAHGDVLLYGENIRSLSKRGHTSGLDFSTGATFALYLTANSIKGYSEENLVNLRS